MTTAKEPRDLPGCTPPVDQCPKVFDAGEYAQGYWCERCDGMTGIGND